MTQRRMAKTRGGPPPRYFSPPRRTSAILGPSGKSSKNRQETNVSQQSDSRRAPRSRSRNPLYRWRPSRRQFFAGDGRNIQRQERRAPEAHRMAQDHRLGEAG